MKPVFQKFWPALLLLLLAVIFLGDGPIRMLHGEALRHGSLGPRRLQIIALNSIGNTLNQ